MKRPDADLVDADLDATLRPLLDAIRAELPAVRLEASRFAAHVASRLQPGASGEDATSLHLADLFLACACIEHDPAALDVFESRCLSVVDEVVSERRFGAALIADVKQQLRAQMLVGTGDRPPTLTQYGGRGPLRGWTRISAIRLAGRLQGPRDARTDNEALFANLPAAPAMDPELSYLQQRYAHEFRAAFTRALASLSERDRTLLMLRVVDGLDPARIAALYDVHRSSVVRWLQRVQEDLLTATRDDMMKRLALSAGEFESLLRLFGSELPMSLQTHLREAEPK